MAGFLEGKVVAVTGGGGGIGRAVARAAADAGARVLVADFGVGMAGEDPSSEVAEAVVTEITQAGGEALAVADDISKMESGERLVATAIEKWGRIDGVVAVAGILRERMLFNMSEDEWDAVIATHLKGHFTVFRAAAAVMRKQEGGGALIGFTSGAFQGSVAQANYAAAKGGIVSLVRSAAVGLHRYGVTANAIAPVARTRMSANVPSELAEMGDAEDVAPMVVYLLSDRAKHVTGQVYTVVGSKIAVWNQPVEVRDVGRRSLDGRADCRAPGRQRRTGANGDDRPSGADAPRGGVGGAAQRLTASSEDPVQTGAGPHRGVDLQRVPLVVGRDDGRRAERLVGEHPAHALAPGDSRARDLALGMLPRGYADLNLVHGLEGDDVGRFVAVSGEPRLLLLFRPDILCHWNLRLDDRHAHTSPSLRISVSSGEPLRTL